MIRIPDRNEFLLKRSFLYFTNICVQSGMSMQHSSYHWDMFNGIPNDPRAML